MSSAPPTSVLVTGANGFVGRAVLAGALARGWRVHATVRPGSILRGLPDSVAVHEVDLTADAQHWRDAMEGVDCVIHAAARAHVLRETASDPAQAFAVLNTQGTRKLATAAADCDVRRFVFVSSIGVNGNLSGAQPFTELSPECPTAPYAVSKRDAERELVQLQDRIETVIVRPPLVYGPHVKANFLRLLQLVDRNVPLPFGVVRNRRSFLFVDNLADLLLTCVTHPAAACNVFLAADGSDFSTPQLLRELAARLGHGAPLVPVPVALLRFGAWLAGRPSMFEQLCGSLTVDSTKAARLLDWQPPTAPAAALDTTVRWYVEAQCAGAK